TLAGMGFPTDLAVLSEPDTTMPFLAGFNFLPRALNTVQAPGTVQATFHVSDDRSGVAWAKVTFVGPGPGGMALGCTSLVVSPGQDPALDVVLVCNVDFPQSSQEGVWTVYGVE